MRFSPKTRWEKVAPHYATEPIFSLYKAGAGSRYYPRHRLLAETRHDIRQMTIVDGKVIERRAYSMFKDLQRRYHWVLPTYAYTDQAYLLATLQEQVIAPAEQKAQELAKR